MSKKFSEYCFHEIMAFALLRILFSNVLEYITTFSEWNLLLIIVWIVVIYSVKFWRESIPGMMKYLPFLLPYDLLLSNFHFIFAIAFVLVLPITLAYIRYRGFFPGFWKIFGIP